MLSWSAQEAGRTVRLAGIVDDRVDPGVEGGRELVALGRAVRLLEPDRGPLAALAQRIGLAAALEAAAVAANFQVMNRVVDATGLSIGKHAQDAQRDVIDQLGLTTFPHAGHEGAELRSPQVPQSPPSSGSPGRLGRVPGDMSTDEVTVQVYWRPGCGACGSLRMALAEAGVPAEWHNIWEDRAASAFVRSVADGNETVPTIVVDGQAHVAPSPRRALEEIIRTAPHLVRRTNRWPPLRIVQWVAIITLLVAFELVAGAGHVGWSYGVDALAVLAYVVFRRLRARAALAEPTRASLT